MTFSGSGDVIYAVHLEEESREEPMYDSSFKTLDAGDYSPIATIDVKRCIYGLCSNKYDTQIAIVENSREYNSPSESIVRLYDVGRLRDDEDVGSEAEEDEEAAEPVDDVDDDDDGSSLDNTDDELDMLEDLEGLVRGRGRNDDESDFEGGGSNGDGSDSSSWTTEDDDDDDSSDGMDELFSLNADSQSSHEGSST